ncbi:MAG: S1C family serine protease [Granulosicoccus sp.]
MNRLLFLALCIFSGLAAGLWFSTTPIGGDKDSNPQSLSPTYSNGPDTSGFQTSQPRSPGVDPSNPTGSSTAIANEMAANSAQRIQSSLSEGSAFDQSNANTRGSANEMVIAADFPAPQSYHKGIMKAAPSVVSVYASGKGEDGTNRRDTSQGSGVIVDRNGIVLTNLHLIEGFESITVVLNSGREYPAILIGSDQETDLAVVRIAASNLPYVRLDEAPPLQVGDIVLAIGNPFDVGQTVTQGIVSAISRRVAGGSAWQNFVQIDAAINPGNSGGALINSNGQLVGVNTAVFRGDTGAVGIGFSIPAELLAQVVPQIIENGSVARGWLGIGVEDLRMFPTLGAQGIQGAVITGVLEGSPASAGGLRYLDVVTGLGEQPIRSATQLLLQVSALPPGATVKVQVLRSNETDTPTDLKNSENLQEVVLKMKLGTRPSPVTNVKR